MPAPKGNKFALGLSTTGHPPIIKDIEELVSKIDGYFDSLIIESDDEKGTTTMQRPTITGMALFLGFCSRQSLYDYAKVKEYSYIIKRAQMVIEMSYEEMLLSKNAGGSIFALKNMGWIDRQEIKQEVTEIAAIKLTDA